MYSVKIAYKRKVLSPFKAVVALITALTVAIFTIATGGQGYSWLFLNSAYQLSRLATTAKYNGHLTAMKYFGNVNSIVGDVNSSFGSEFYGNGTVPDDFVGPDSDMFSKYTTMVWNFFIKNGFSPEATAGIMGNMHREGASARYNDIAFNGMGFQSTPYASNVERIRKWIADIDSGATTKKQFGTQSYNSGSGMGLIGFTHHTIKEKLYQMAHDKNKSIIDPIVQCECIIEYYGSTLDYMREKGHSVSEYCAYFEIKVERHQGTEGVSVQEAIDAQSGTGPIAEKLHNAPKLRYESALKIYEVFMAEANKYAVANNPSMSNPVLTADAQEIINLLSSATGFSTNGLSSARCVAIANMFTIVWYSNYKQKGRTSEWDAWKRKYDAGVVVYSDCSASIHAAWQSVGISLPLSTHGYGDYKNASRVKNTVLVSKEQLQPGDLLVNREPDDSGHMEMFLSWADADHTKAYTLSMNTSYGRTLAQRCGGDYNRLSNVNSLPSGSSDGNLHVKRLSEIKYCFHIDA